MALEAAVVAEEPLVEDEMLAGAEVVETVDPSAKSSEVVVVPLLLVVDVLVAPCSAARNGSVDPSADVLALLESLEPSEPPELPT